MKTIVVDDESWMLRRFEMVSENLSDVQLVGSFRNPLEALAFAKENTVELAFLDVEMPEMNGLDLAEHLRKVDPQIIIIFISAYENYIAEAFRKKTADYYLLKPYDAQDIEEVVERARLLSRRLQKKVSVRTFGRFELFVDDTPIAFSDDLSREVLALLVDRRGGVISDEDACQTLLPDLDEPERTTRYHEAVSHMRDTLGDARLGGLVVQNDGGIFLNTHDLEIDLNKYLEGDMKAVLQYNDDYMQGYAWAESRRQDLLRQWNLVNRLAETQTRNRLCASIRYLDDEPLTMTLTNASFLKLVGYTSTELRELFSNSLRALILRDDFEHIDLVGDGSGTKDETDEVTFRLIDKHGDEVWVICLREPARPTEKEGLHEITCILINISELKSEHDHLEHEAHYDGLTGLLNRSTAQKRIENYLNEQPEPHVDALILMDVDRFKSVNDTYGHPFADTILQAVAAVLGRSFRSCDIVSRWGGDEILIFLKGIGDRKQAGEVLVTASADVADTLRFKTKHGEITCSFGGALFPSDGNAFDQLYKQADDALYMAKKKRNCTVWHDEL